MTNQTCILIPAYCPTEKIVQYVHDLNSQGITDILVVNDGSSNAYDPIFLKLEKLSFCEIIGYPENKGKGAALKYGYSHILETKPNITGVITVDCDGQHTVNDVLKINNTLCSNTNTLILGVRNFNVSSNGEKIPFRSKLGNSFSSFIFYLLYHRHLSDTQTGLRGFSSSLLPFMTRIKGSRYEYETQVLIDCVKENIPFQEIPISTIYEDNNSCSHFHPIKDSFRIICTMFQGFFLFISSSLLSSVIDILCAWFLLDLLRFAIKDSNLLRIMLATVIARIISMSFNYLLNKKIVFKDNTSHSSTMIRYIFLCIIVMLLSSIFVYLTSHYLYWNEKIAKIIGDSLLFFFSYYAQKGWVFHHE